MLPEEPTFMPYAPGNRTVGVVQRLHAGTNPATLTEKALISLGVPETNADRVQKALRFLGLINAEFEITPEAVRLRRATSDEYRLTLAEIVHTAYQPVFVSYDPATATGLELNDAFKPYDPAGQRGNMIALFMALCREAGLAPESGPIRRRGRPPGSSKGRDSTASRPGAAKPPYKPEIKNVANALELPTNYDPLLRNLLQTVTELESDTELVEWWELFRPAFAFVKNRAKKQKKDEA